jgi:osmoprotectant transport system permease protein
VYYAGGHASPSDEDDAMGEMLAAAYRYGLANRAAFWGAVGIHVRLSVLALLIGAAVCIPLGLYVARRRPMAPQVLAAFSGLRVVPSLAILFLAVPYLGLGFLPALAALTVLACPPVLINTEAAFRGIDPATVEAARGMGMSPGQVLRRVEVPLATPVVVAGLRTAAVDVFASATLAAFIGGGGLGDFIARGFALFDPAIMLVGAIPVAILTLGAEMVLAGVQRALEYLAHTA